MEEQNLSRKEREFLQRRLEILRRALALFSEKGFHGTSMQEIAEKSEFAVGTLYNFFSNKDEIYKTLIVETADKFHSSLTRALEAEGTELEKIRASLEAKIQVFLENLDYVRIYFAETQGAVFNLKAGLDVKIRALYEDYLQKLAALFQSGMRRKIFKKENPYLLALAFDSISTSFLVEHMEHPDRHGFDCDVVLNLFLYGALGKEGKPS